MIIKKFQAKTEEEAVSAAKREMGENVVIMSVRNLKKKGMFSFLKKPVVEVTVGMEEETERPAQNAFSMLAKQTVATRQTPKDRDIYEESEPAVKKTDKGLTISIENIQFGGESAVLLNSEKIKLRKIADILKGYPDNDILVSGHTAHYPGGADPQQLSEERAASVADFLVQLGVKDKFHVFTQGFGDKQPIDTNETPEGRAKNRRVEITIMDE